MTPRIGYEANAFETIHYEFTPENAPCLTPGMATHYSLYTGRPGPHRMPIPKHPG
jgi:hypothetical protein